MATTTTAGVAKGAALKRNLGLWAIVGLGLGYMTPTVVFDTFGNDTMSELMGHRNDIAGDCLMRMDINQFVDEKLIDF